MDGMRQLNLRLKNELAHFDFIFYYYNYLKTHMKIRKDLKYYLWFLQFPQII